MIEFLTRVDRDISHAVSGWWMNHRDSKKKKVSLFFQVFAIYEKKKSLSFQILLGDIQFQEDHEPQPWYNIRNDQNFSLLSLEIVKKKAFAPGVVYPFNPNT